MTPHDLSERLWDFAARIGKVGDALPETRLDRHVAGQLVRCGTSSGPNYDEACAGESRADFTHKISVALKELRETRGWLRFIIKTQMLPQPRVVPSMNASNWAISWAAPSSPPKTTALLASSEPQRVQFKISNSQF